MVKKALIIAKMRRPRNNIPPTTPSTIGNTGASVGQLTVKRHKDEALVEKLRCSLTGSNETRFTSFRNQSHTLRSFVFLLLFVFASVFSGTSLFNCSLLKAPFRKLYNAMTYYLCPSEHTTQNSCCLLPFQW